MNKGENMKSIAVIGYGSLGKILTSVIIKQLAQEYTFMSIGCDKIISSIGGSDWNILCTKQTDVLNYNLP